jgi:hypothetical protein
VSAVLAVSAVSAVFAVSPVFAVSSLPQEIAKKDRTTKSNAVKKVVFFILNTPKKLQQIKRTKV